MNKLEGKTALITGAGSGMGRAIAQKFVANGAIVALVDLNVSGLEATRADIGEDAFVLQGDISSGAEVLRLFAEAEAWLGQVDILVNCAGVHDHFVPLHESEDALWEKIMAVNLRAPFQFTRAALLGMRERGHGVIVNVASAAAFVGGGGGAAYTSSKHGVIGLTRQTAVENARHGIRANVICPGPVISGMTQKLLEPGSEGEKVAASTLVGRMGTAEEIAKTALFLASEDSSFVHGAAYMVDGGYTVV